jgi:hypothetical protein
VNPTAATDSQVGAIALAHSYSTSTGREVACRLCDLYLRLVDPAYRRMYGSAAVKEPTELMLITRIPRETSSR